MKIKKSEKRPLSWIFWIAYATGAALFVFSHWIRTQTAVGPQHHPLESWVRIAHSTVTYVLVLGLGFLVKAHVLPGLKAKKHLVSGISVLALFALLIGTALGVLYGGGADADSVNYFAWAHALIGLSLPLLIVAHVAGKKASVRAPRVRSGGGWARRVSTQL